MVLSGVKSVTQGSLPPPDSSFSDGLLPETHSPPKTQCLHRLCLVGYGRWDSPFLIEPHFLHILFPAQCNVPLGICYPPPIWSPRRGGYSVCPQVPRFKLSRSLSFSFVKVGPGFTSMSFATKNRLKLTSLMAWEIALLLSLIPGIALLFFRAGCEYKPILARHVSTETFITTRPSPLLSQAEFPLLIICCNFDWIENPEWVSGRNFRAHREGRFWTALWLVH